MSELFDKEALTYRSREKIKCAKYQKGMENGYILSFYQTDYPSCYGEIICKSLDKALEEMKKPRREKTHLMSDNECVDVTYNVPIPIMINGKYTDEEYELFCEYGYAVHTCFIDDTAEFYDYEEITEENCWIIKNLIDGRYFTASTEFMQEYELLEDKEN